MKKFFSHFFEYLLIGLTILFLLVKPNLPNYGERISMLFFGSLSFYYLASGLLVFLDKKRVGRIMRLMYLFGLWSVSIMVIAVMARVLLLQMDEELLLVSISAGVGIQFYLQLYYRGLKEEDKEAFKYFIAPLFFRSLFAIMIGIAFVISSSYGIYSMLGTYRHDPVYVEKIVDAYEHPHDSLIVNDYKKYDSLLHVIPVLENK